MAEETSTTILDLEKPVEELEQKIAELKSMTPTPRLNLENEVKALEEKRDQLIAEIFSSLAPWQKVQLARHPKRPYTLDYLQALFTDFTELHGDRLFADDAALVGGTAFFESIAVVVMGQQKGRTVEESMERNFGMMHPEGYRKALRLMKLAEKFHKPVITFIDTPGAYPGIGAEERGQAEAIARNLREMGNLKTPIVSVVIGEGGSGGALGIGVADRILMLENAWYSVISPEGCAAILFRDAAKAPEAAAALKLTAQDLLTQNVVDEIVPEPLGGAHRNFEFVTEQLRKILKKHLLELADLAPETLVEKRYEKYRKMGKWEELEKVQGAVKKMKKTKMKGGK